MWAIEDAETKQFPHRWWNARVGWVLDFELASRFWKKEAAEAEHKCKFLTAAAHIVEVHG